MVRRAKTGPKPTGSPVGTKVSYRASVVGRFLSCFPGALYTCVSLHLRLAYLALARPRAPFVGGLVWSHFAAWLLAFASFGVCVCVCV